MASLIDLHRLSTATYHHFDTLFSRPISLSETMPYPPTLSSVYGPKSSPQPSTSSALKRTTRSIRYQSIQQLISHSIIQIEELDGKNKVVDRRKVGDTTDYGEILNTSKVRDGKITFSEAIYDDRPHLYRRRNSVVLISILRLKKVSESVQRNPSTRDDSRPPIPHFRRKCVTSHAIWRC